MTSFIKYANQKDICVKKPKVRTPFVSIDERYLWEAMRELTSGGFKLWLYIASNKHDFSFALSHKAVKTKTGISKGTYDSAVKELIDKGYLIRYKETNHYHFVVDATLKDMDKYDYFAWCGDTNKRGFNWDNEDKCEDETYESGDKDWD